MSTIDLTLRGRSRALTLPTRNRAFALRERPGMGDITLTFVDGTIIEFVGGGPLEQVSASIGTFSLPARNRAITLRTRNRALTLEDRS